MDNFRVAAVPGSKSITNRALLLAALSNREYLLKGSQFSDDSRCFLSALKSLGFSVLEDETAKTVRITGTGGRVPEKEAEIYVGSAGTAARFLTAMLAFSDGSYTIRASEQMYRRPMKPLFDALSSLGVEFTYLGEAGHLPVRLKGIFAGQVLSDKNLTGNVTEPVKTDASKQCGEYQITKSSVNVLREEAGELKVSLDISESTQYLSALLMTASMLPGDLVIQITGNKKRGSYIEITRRMMAEFGIRTDFDGESYAVRSPIRTPAPDGGPVTYRIEPDVSAACYFYAAVMLTGGSVQVRHVHMDSMQGDLKFLSLLEQMGASIQDTSEGICAEMTSSSGTPVFPGLEVNMNDFSDQAITLAALAPFATSPTVISGIAHIRRQESDRLHGMAENLTRMGIRTEETEDSIKIWPGIPKPCEIETYDDHRMAMGFALTGLRVPGMIIKNPQCCQKTFPEYFDEMEKVFSLKFSDR